MASIYQNLHIVNSKTGGEIFEAAYNLKSEGVAPCNMAMLETHAKEKEHARVLRENLSPISEETEAVLFLLPLGTEGFCVALYTKQDRTVAFVSSKCDIREEMLGDLKEVFRIICLPLQQNKILKFISLPQKPLRDVSATYLLPIMVTMLRLGGKRFIDVRAEIDKNGTITLQEELHKHTKRSWNHYCTFRRMRYVLEYANHLAQTLDCGAKSYLEFYWERTPKQRQTRFTRWKKEHLSVQDPGPWLALEFAEVEKWLQNMEFMRLEMDSGFFQRCLPNGIGKHLDYKAAQQEQYDPTPLLYSLSQNDLLAWQEYFIKYDA